MKKKTILLTTAFILLQIATSVSYAQQPVNRDTMLVAAREIMSETHYCALVTMDSTGQPQVRTMNPFPPAGDNLIWFATSRTSRKVKEMKANPRVSVYFADHVTAKGYVTITGTAEVIDDKDLLLRMKREYWNGIPGWQEKFVLVKITPKTLEVINYRHGLNNDPETFRAPSLTY